MKLALECPTSMLKDIQPLADFDWILAHLADSDPNYFEYYRDSKKLKVLDNSVNELLEPTSIDELEKIARHIGVSQIVAPDYLGDSQKTIKSIEKSIEVFGQHRVIPVVQGSTLDEVAECFRFIRSRDFIGAAIPYDILSSREDTPEGMAKHRLAAVNHMISHSPTSFSFHLLGMTTIEELENHNRGWVKSIDTGVPVMMGLKGYRLDVDRLENKKKPTMELMEGITSLDPDFREMMVYRNIAYLRKILQ